MKPEAGLLIGNRFRLLSLVGVGSFGSLWRAADRIPGKQVALRIIGDPTFGAAALDAFRREMIAATAVRHRSLAHIESAGWDAHGGVWVARELVDGESLEYLLDRQAPSSAVDALMVISELASALAEVHALGLEHGAVSARTILMQRSKTGVTRPVLVGLGRARLLRSTLPAYTSPEALASQHYGAASDVWSLGVLLFRCVTGRLPFAARTPAAMEVETRRLNRLLSTIEDVGVRHLVAKCFTLHPDARPKASELARLAGLLARELEREQEAATSSTSEPPVELEPAPIESLAPAAMSLPPPKPTPPPLRKRPAPAAPVASPEPPPVIAAVPVNDNGADEEVDFRPSRPRAKLILSALAAAAIFGELFVATRQPRQPPPAAAAHVEPEPLRAPEPPPVVVPPPPAAASTTAVADAVPPTPVAPTAAPSASVAETKAKPKVALPKAAPRPAKKDEENPYE
ncbi:MAG: protein kinase domain-containing protein [Polyangiales bacterium]